MEGEIRKLRENLGELYEVCTNNRFCDLCPVGRILGLSEDECIFAPQRCPIYHLVSDFKEVFTNEREKRKG